MSSGSSSRPNHCRFPVLDELDCWLHPDLVERLVSIVSEAGRARRFQVLKISDRDRAAFDTFRQSASLR